MMTFAGGRSQADYMARVRGIPPEQCLVVPIDVGKHTAVSLVADHEGRVVQDPMTFPMTATGTRTLMRSAVDAERAARAGMSGSGSRPPVTITGCWRRRCTPAGSMS
jgi:hypothetical protein